MNFLKFSVVLLTLFAATVFAANSSQGKRDCHTDILLLEETIKIDPIPYEQQKQDIRFPKDGEYNTRPITAIYIYDRTTDNPGITSHIYSGGVGYTFASGVLKSQFGKGIHATIRVYGK